MTFKFVYNLSIYCISFVLKIVALFNHKIELGVSGRRKSFHKLKAVLHRDTKNLWFHCASLGEYEQGLPVFEKLRTQYPNHKIILSFFSPSGYEIRKNTTLADVVIYLPLDTPGNAKRFANLVAPELTVFVKYDIWPNYLLELNKKNLKAILISASFRKNQIYFKPYGKIFRKALHTFAHIFVQNEASKVLLNSINYLNASVSGDTRFDRVSNQLTMNNALPFIETFKNDKLCVVVGSSWPEDEILFTEFIKRHNIQNIKFIFAPHNIKSAQIKNLQTNINIPSVLFSEKQEKQIDDFNVLIVDTIGLLSKIYHYADIAYVGGAMGTTGLHNTLEPAVFGVPIIIGKNHSKFPEAKDLIENGGMFSIKNQKEFNKILEKLLQDGDYRNTCGSKNHKYVSERKGAVIQILEYLRK